MKSRPLLVLLFLVFVLVAACKSSPPTRRPSTHRPRPAGLNTATTARALLSLQALTPRQATIQGRIVLSGGQTLPRPLRARVSVHMGGEKVADIISDRRLTTLKHSVIPVRFDVAQPFFPDNGPLKINLLIRFPAQKTKASLRFPLSVSVPFIRVTSRWTPETISWERDTRSKKKLNPQQALAAIDRYGRTGRTGPRPENNLKAPFLSTRFQLTFSFSHKDHRVRTIEYAVRLKRTGRVLTKERHTITQKVRDWSKNVRVPLPASGKAIIAKSIPLRFSCQATITGPYGRIKYTADSIQTVRSPPAAKDH